MAERQSNGGLYEVHVDDLWEQSRLGLCDPECD
jgi:hypothetical protein